VVILLLYKVITRENILTKFEDIPEEYFMNTDDLPENFQDLPESLKNIAIIADKVIINGYRCSIERKMVISYQSIFHDQHKIMFINNEKRVAFGNKYYPLIDLEKEKVGGYYLIETNNGPFAVSVGWSQGPCYFVEKKDFEMWKEKKENRLWFIL
jgi:hypothetical protein